LPGLLSIPKARRRKGKRERAKFLSYGRQEIFEFPFDLYQAAGELPRGGIVSAKWVKRDYRTSPHKSPRFLIATSRTVITIRVIAVIGRMKYSIAARRSPMPSLLVATMMR